MQKHDMIQRQHTKNSQISGHQINIALGQQLGGCFTNVSRALQNILSKFVYCRNSTCDQNFKLKLCTCAQSHALGTCTTFQLEILIINVISGVVYFREIILESSRNISETTPWFWWRTLATNGAQIQCRWHTRSGTVWHFSVRKNLSKIGNNPTIAKYRLSMILVAKRIA